MNGLELDYADTQLDFMRFDANSEEGAAIQQSYALRGHPSIALIDANGNAVQKYVGAQSAETLQIAIDDLIKANP